jgi:hypothetical protein
MTCCLIPSLRGFGQAVPPVSFWKRDSGTTRHTLSEATFWVEGQPFSLRDGFWLLSPVADAPSRNGRRQLRRFAPRVKMLQYTQARQRYRGRCGSQPLFRWPPVRRILLQRVVDDQDTPPNSPEAAHSSPEEAVEGVQRRTRPPAFQDRDLLSKGTDFESRVTATVEEDVDGGEDGEHEFEHEFLLKHGVTRHSQADRAEKQAAILKTL